MREATSDATCQEIATRIIAELSSSGTPVLVVTCTSPPRSCLGDAGLQPSAVMIIQCRGGVRLIEVRTGAALPSGTAQRPDADDAQVQRIEETDAGGGAASLAIRGTDLLKAMWTEPASPLTATPEVSASASSVPVAGELKAQARVSSPASDVSTAAPQEEDPDLQTRDTSGTSWAGPRPVARGSNNLTVNVGAAVIGGFKGLHSAFGPSVGVGRRISDYILVSGILTGPAFGAEQQIFFDGGTSLVGTASLRHEMALLQADWLGLFWNAVVLKAGVATGVYHVHVDERLSGFDPVAGQSLREGSAGAYAAVASATLGVVFNLRADMGIFVEGRALVLGPTPVILLNGTEIGRSGNPAASLAAGLELRL